MPRNPQRIDLGDAFPDTSNNVGEFVTIGPMWGLEFRVLKGFNLFSGLRAGDDVSVYTKLVVNAIHPDDQLAFLNTIDKQRNLDDPEEFMKVVNAIVNAASGNPQISSGASSAGTPKKRVTSRSAAR